MINLYIIKLKVLSVRQDVHVYIVFWNYIFKAHAYACMFVKVYNVF